jgi:hypothetical protein
MGWQRRGSKGLEMGLFCPFRLICGLSFLVLDRKKLRLLFVLAFG